MTKNWIILCNYTSKVNFLAFFASLSYLTLFIHFKCISLTEKCVHLILLEYFTDQGKHGTWLYVHVPLVGHILYMVWSDLLYDAYHCIRDYCEWYNWCLFLCNVYPSLLIVHLLLWIMTGGDLFQFVNIKFIKHTLGQNANVRCVLSSF